MMSKEQCKSKQRVNSETSSMLTLQYVSGVPGCKSKLIKEYVHELIQLYPVTTRVSCEMINYLSDLFNNIAM